MHRGAWGGGPPAEGLGGWPAPSWATAAATVGPGGGDRLGWGHIRVVYEALTDCTKPRQTFQSPDRLYKAPTRLYKDLAYYTPQKMLDENLNMFNKTSK